MSMLSQFTRSSRPATAIAGVPALARSFAAGDRLTAVDALPGPAFGSAPTLS